MKIELRDYQIDIKKKILEERASGTKEIVLAACPSSGKTVIICDLLKSESNSKAIILTHGQNLLKYQWEKELNVFGLGSESSQEIKSDSRIIYGLPQTFSKRNLANLKNIDYLIIDEAHEFTFAKMVQKIKETLSPKFIIYLTGTPSKFIKKGYKVLCIPASDLIQKEYVSDLYIGMVSTNAKLVDKDYNQDGDITETKAKKLEQTVNSDLDELLNAIHKRLRETNFFKGSPNLRQTVEWAPTLGVLHKTMIACRSIKQANKVYRYFKKQEISVLMSNSENDPNTENIEKFIKEGSSYKVLVVVDRGILGFNMLDLVNVVDLTCSRNIDRIYQLYARVMRKNDQYPNKYFFKFSPDDDMLINKFYMNAALMLMFEDFIVKYNGKNLNGCNVPVFVKRDRKKNKGVHSHSFKDKKKPTISIDPAFFESVKACEILIDIRNKINERTNEYAYVTFGEIKADILGNKFKRRIVNITEENLRYMIETGEVDERIYL